ncbi:hypothetical protein [Arthrobacter sp. CG_A4]|uniref:hypothetical protein n=1 Tax=Arthrobacter sp. CG_A4 TaxID=3071706 RepID=UPI002DFC6AC8|nr:hypothetical protein [Arthrobacter sp. CG_A4]
MDGSFYGPLGYSGWFPWAALGLLVLVAVWYAYVVLSTRRRTGPGVQEATRFTPPSDISGLQQDYLRRIDSVAREAQAGARSARAAHQELSLLIRSFTRDVSGVDAPRMTLADLRSVDPHGGNLPAVAEAIGRFYPAEFAAAPGCAVPGFAVQGSACQASAVPEAAETAREVIRSWN